MKPDTFGGVDPATPAARSDLSLRSWISVLQPNGSYDLNRHGFVRSMSRKGNCWDNADAESSRNCRNAEP